MSSHSIPLKAAPAAQNAKQAIAGPHFPQSTDGQTLSVSALGGQDLLVSINKVPDWQGSDHIKLFLKAGEALFWGDYWVPGDSGEVVDPEFTFPVDNTYVGKTFTTWYTHNNGPESERVSVLIIA